MSAAHDARFDDIRIGTADGVAEPNDREITAMLLRSVSGYDLAGYARQIRQRYEESLQKPQALADSESVVEAQDMRYKICPGCGAHLDYGECCDCLNEERKDGEKGHDECDGGRDRRTRENGAACIAGVVSLTGSEAKACG